MSTIYMSQLPNLPLMEGDQDQGHFPAFHLAKDPPILFPFVINNPMEQQGQSYGDQHLRQQVLGESNQQFNDHMMMGGSDVFPTPSSFRPTIQSIGGDMIQRSSYDPYDIEKKHAVAVGSAGKQWTSAPPAKMRIVRKAVNDPDSAGAARKPRRRAQAYQDESQTQQQHQQAMGVIRVCSDCNTTKTPLWRSGPCGPKSLCNACGIRQRKARRAMAAAAAAADNGGAAAVTASDAQAKPTKKEKRADVDRSLPFKKRCKMVDHAAAPAATTAKTSAGGDAAPKEDHDHDHADGVEANVSKGPPAPFFHGFPRDEITDAAMLLMTLSCGLVRG